MRRYRAIGILIVILVLLVTLFSRRFFFNPITFEENGITYLPFKEYRNPMSYSYWGDNIEVKDVHNNKDIHYLYDQLLLCEKLGTNIPDDLIAEDNGCLSIYSYHPELGKANTTDLWWLGGESDIIRVGGRWEISGVVVSSQYVRLTPGLKAFLNQLFTAGI